MAGTSIFVGGLPHNCHDEALSDYFCQYGTITDSVVMKDRRGNSRGFGYVTFSEGTDVGMVFAHYNGHRINGKWVEVKRRIPKRQRELVAKLQERLDVLSAHIQAAATLRKMMDKIEELRDKFDSDNSAVSQPLEKVAEALTRAMDAFRLASLDDQASERDQAS